MATKAEKIALLQGSARSFEFFGANCLKVRSKDRDLVPFKMNPPQRIVHEALEKQKRETGKVRAIILKSRRMGMSTYIAARYYWMTSMNEGYSTAIVAHVQKTVGSLYNIVKRYHEHNPIAPTLGTSNVREMVFPKLDSRYSVFSAEGGEGGRGEDVTLLHPSEFAFYAKPEVQLAGIFEAVPDKPGTEIIIETTADKPYGEFYDMCQAAMRGIGEYQFIFVPWSADPDNVRPVPKDFEVETTRIDNAFPSEAELVEQYGLSLEQIAWRRGKMNGPRNLLRFVREYPLTPSDAFTSQAERALINPADVIRARKASMIPLGEKVIGIDPAGKGKDRFAIAMRQGNAVSWVATRKKTGFNEGVEWVKRVIKEENPVMVNIDAGGGGNGSAIAAALSEDPKYARIIRAVNFGGTSQSKLANPDKPGPRNRRAEMWGRVAEWLESDIPCSLPDEDSIQQDLLLPTVKRLPNGDWILDSKAEAKLSPDEGDAIALTFANRYIAKEDKGVLDNKNVVSFGASEFERGSSWMI